MYIMVKFTSNVIDDMLFSYNHELRIHPDVLESNLYKLDKPSTAV